MRTMEATPKDNIEFPVQFQPFDLVLVDGRARTECMQKGRDSRIEMEF